MSSLFPPVLDVPFARGPSCLPIKLKHTHTQSHTLSILSQFPPRPVCYNVPSSLCFSFFSLLGFASFFSFPFFFLFPISVLSLRLIHWHIVSNLRREARHKKTWVSSKHNHPPPPPSIKHGTSNTMMTSDGGDKHSVDVWVRTAVNKQMMNPVITALGSPLHFPRPSPSLISVSLFSRPPLFSQHVPSPSPPRSFWSPRGT